MKKQFFFSMLAAAAMMASCSSDREVAEKQVIGDGYLAVKIELPQTPTTRALNDEYADGTAKEYQVNNAILYLFKGNSATNAKYNQYVTLNGDKFMDDTENPVDNITLSQLAVGRVADVTLGSGEHFYALVIVNGTTSTLTLTPGSTQLADVLAQTSSANFYTGTGASATNFLMLNAPLSNAVGGNAASAPAAANVNYLVQLADDCIKESETLAKNNPAGSIYVERAVAKATLSCSANTIAGTMPIKTNGITWAIDNKEPESYILRNMGTLDYLGYASQYLTPDNYRMVGSVKMGTTSIQPEETLYRTYWCIDPQYTKDYKDLSPALFTAAVDADYIAADGNTPAYCHENTFDVLRQKYGNTTRAIIKVELEDASDFYTFVGSQTKYTKSAAQTYFAEHIILNADFNSIMNESSNFNASTTDPATVTASDLDITYTRDADGIYKVSAIAFTSAWISAHVENGNPLKRYKTTPVINTSAIINDVNSFVQMYEYKGGVVYYDTRFMHFASTTSAQDLAPWNTAAEAEPGDVTHAYKDGTKTKEENYLGRYGMVRNNWYDVTVTAFNKLGYPVAPRLEVTGDTPDDKVNEQFISVKLNVLSWAKRTQSVTF